MSATVSVRPGEDNSFRTADQPGNAIESKEGGMAVSQRRSEDLLIESMKPLPTSLQRDFLPDDVLLALTQPPVAKEQLGPPTRHKILPTTVAGVKQKPANVWNFQRKDRFKHLAENTPCICGSGRDLSFLYDVPQQRKNLEKDDGFDPSAVRKEMDDRKKTGLKLPDTLLPDEYHIVKNKGVMGIEYHEDKYTTQPDDHEKHLVVFPSLKPAGRYEVVQLRQAMEQMLDKAGVNDLDVEIKGPTQMHNLLELIKKEQNIYNVIFHELIRQVSIECVDRGELLSDLRNKYSALLNKVPHQIKSLHEEVLAQRALDRRLTEELMRFKATITILTNELSEVKEHDHRVTREAQEAQEDLRTALSEAQKNATLLSEYHELYELQRHRLENQVTNLTEEKEIWSTAAYCLALKVTAECKLTTAKSLHVSEKAWSKLANHFTILLSDKDTEMLTQIQGYVEKWRDLIEDFNMALKRREEDMKSHLRKVKKSLEKWSAEYGKMCFSKDGHFESIPDTYQIQVLLDAVKSWELVITEVTESLTGETFLSSEEELIFIRKHMDSWTDSAIKCFGRHRGPGGANHPELEMMMGINEEVDDLIKQFFVRLTGENGTAQGIIHLLNMFETWSGKLTAHLNGTVMVNDSEWSRFNLLLDDWLTETGLTIEYVGSTQKTDDRNDNKPHTRRDVNDVVRKCQKWVSSATNSVDSEDAKLVEQVGSLHSEMIKWMVQILLRLAPNRADNSKEAADMSLIGSSTVSQLQTTAKSLFERLTSFSKYVTLCCDGIVLDNTQLRRDNREEDPEHEYRDLQRLRTECNDWVQTAKILMSQLTGDPIETLFPQEASQSAGSKKSKKGSTEKRKSSVQGIPEETSSEKQQGEVPTKTHPTEPSVPEETSQEVINKDIKEPQKQSADTSQEVLAQSQPDTKVSTEPVADGEGIAAESGTAQDVGEEVERVEALGFDMNTHVHDLADKAAVKGILSAPQSEEELPTPEPSKAETGSDSLTALVTLQGHLVNTEERCQAAEERAVNAETELADCQERIRALEKTISQMQKAAAAQASQAAEAGKAKVSETPVEKTGESSSVSPSSTDRRASKDSSTSDGKPMRDVPEAKLKRSDSRASSKSSSRGRKK